MKTITYEALIDEVAFLDGALRDIYIYNVHLKEWDRLLKILKERYTLKCEEGSIPDSVLEIIPIRRERGFCLNVCIGEGILANCHFFISEAFPNPIEFDLDPREFRTPEGIRSVLQFMRILGDGLGFEVYLTQENSEEVILLTYSPTNKQYVCHLEKDENRYVSDY